MHFQSVKEYFYKLYTRLFLLLLLPLATFLALYGAIQGGELTPMELADEQHAIWLRYIFLGAAVTDWIGASVFFSWSLKPVRTLVSLGEKLDRYFFLTIIRFVIIVFGMMVLAGGYYLLHDQVLTALFIVSLLMMGLVWPFPGRVTSHLHLKEDEKNWVQEWK